MSVAEMAVQAHLKRLASDKVQEIGQRLTRGRIGRELRLTPKAHLQLMYWCLLGEVPIRTEEGPNGG